MSADRSRERLPHRATPTRVLVLIAIVLIAVPVLMVVGVAVFAALAGTTDAVVPWGGFVWLVLILVAFVVLGGLIVRAGTRT